MDILCYSVVFLLAVILLLSTRLLRSKDRSKKNPPPSPPSLPIIGHLHLLKKPLHISFSNLAARQGPVLALRFGSRPVLLVSSAAAAEECFSKNDIIFANRPHLLAGKHLGYDYTTIAWASYGSHWRNLRRITTLEIFSTSRLHSFMGIRREEVVSMIKGLARVSASEEGFRKVVLRPRLFELALNVMMRMIAEKRYYGEEVADAEEAERFREIAEETFRVSGSSNLEDFLPVLKCVGFGRHERRLVTLQGRRDAFLQGLVEERRRREDCSSSATVDGEVGEGQEERRKTIMDVLLELQASDPEYYTDEIIKGVIVVLLTAGTDTSAVTIEWAMSLLLNHPEVLNKAQAELDSVVGQDRLVEESDLRNLTFLHCIINETLRLHPAATVIPAHESSEACTVGGFDVSHGTMLLVNAWAIHRDPELWVEPTRFKPERFVDADGLRERNQLIPFGSGRRRCPGEGLAMHVVGLVLGALIQCFEWDPGCEEVDLSEGTGLTTPKAKPLEAFCRPRPFMANIVPL